MAELYRVISGNYGESKGGVDKEDAAIAKKTIKDIGDRIFKYWDYDIKINIKQLLNILYESFPTLKIDRGEELDAKVVYSSIYKYVQRYKNYPTKCYLTRKGFYALLTEDMLEVASDMNINKTILIKLLKQFDLLHLQGSSIGNQCEVKGVGSCYCIKMLARFQPTEVEKFNEGKPFNEL